MKVYEVKFFRDGDRFMWNLIFRYMTLEEALKKSRQFCAHHLPEQFEARLRKIKGSTIRFSVLKK
jgi:hypothetical protein